MRGVVKRIYSLAVLCLFMSSAVASNQINQRMCSTLENNLVSVQLHSVKQLIEQDFEGTLVELKNAGFHAVDMDNLKMTRKVSNSSLIILSLK